ncbi:PREDICTED: uncharacterized protein LOC18600448 isoform X1 [Theobroma cacao]|uniref:Uncharacterized protein LOC18600448 isoform X1 n=2 Tax=Theobroma cacao TaxID=3641 RepID=A0AB32V5T2_THECC|nr:PREDICTED: uncharacterized protein LOC18600448 isoform X1 [Theobroma cacao]EOY11458.1 Uncharacterized protein TCM_026626 [Theobroma cacao]
MACFVSFSISVPLCSLQIPLKDRYPRKSGLCRLPGLPTTKTASYFPPPWSSNKGIFSVSGQHHPTILSKHFDEIVSCSLYVSSCTHMVITGYWVGPDIDDGWGFVEASIDQSS